jgi:hypothetical protein
VSIDADRIQAVRVALSDLQLYLDTIALTNQQQRAMDKLQAAVTGLDGPEAQIKRALDEAVGETK